MKLPEVENADKYVGLYVVDFGDHSGLGFTADEVAELLESKKFADVKVYKIHRASPDGQMELKGVTSQTFQLEKGMFFYTGDNDMAQGDYKRLVELAGTTFAPCRAKVHLAKYSDEKFVTAIIYPAEHDDEISQWLIDGSYKTAGPAEGGIEAVQRYYDQAPDILQRHQLFAAAAIDSRSGDQLLAAVKLAVQR
jgi:hypothetical protein